jgi:SAM-dependent methyltransferase
MEQHMDHQSTYLSVDWSRTSSDYARHRAGFPPSFFARLEGAGLVERGARALDLGTGTGAVALGLAARGMRVVGVDVDEGQLVAARRAAARDGVEIEFRRASAEDTGAPDASAVLVTAGQCWHWFDRGAAAREAMRVLAPGGTIVIAHFDWLERPGNVLEATMELAERHGATLHPVLARCQVRSFYPYWLDDLFDAGFVRIESESHDVEQRYTHEAWRGRMRASALIGATLEPARVEAFDGELAALLSARFPDPMKVPHRVFVVRAKKERTPMSEVGGAVEIVGRGDEPRVAVVRDGASARGRRRV